MGGFLFGMLIWADYFILLEGGFLDKMVGVDVLLDVVVVEVVVVETVDVVQVWFFIFFWCVCLGGYDGCESGDRGCGWSVGVGVVEVFCSVRIGVGVGSVRNRGGTVVSGGGNASVADGGAKWRDCCRFPNGIFGEFLEGLPYRLPFTLDISDFFS